MILTLLCLCHYYVARTLIPYYEIKYQAIEAANLMIECWQHEFEKESDRSQTSDVQI